MVEHRSGTPGLQLSDLAARLKDQKVPPVDRWDPPFCGDIDMRIARDGSWHYLGTPINRPEMVRLFASVLKREEDGRIYLVTPVEKLGIIVDDAPFYVVEMEVTGEGEDQRLLLRTLTEDVIDVDEDHPVWMERVADEDRPYVHVRKGLNGLIARPVYYEMVERASEERVDGVRHLGLWSNGAFFSLGEAP